jgi:hypothetical protein
MPLPKEKIELLRKLFTQDAMSPGQAAEKAGVTYATANRYYTKWESEIRQSLERQLLPKIEESIRQQKRKAKLAKPSRPRAKH